MPCGKKKQVFKIWIFLPSWKHRSLRHTPGILYVLFVSAAIRVMPPLVRAPPLSSYLASFKWRKEVMKRARNSVPTDLQATTYDFLPWNLIPHGEHYRGRGIILNYQSCTEEEEHSHQIIAQKMAKLKATKILVSLQKTKNWTLLLKQNASVSSKDLFCFHHNLTDSSS